MLTFSITCVFGCWLITVNKCFPLICRQRILLWSVPTHLKTSSCGLEGQFLPDVTNRMWQSKLWNWIPVIELLRLNWFALISKWNSYWHILRGFKFMWRSVKRWRWKPSGANRQFGNFPAFLSISQQGALRVLATWFSCALFKWVLFLLMLSF